MAKLEARFHDFVEMLRKLRGGASFFTSAASAPPLNKAEIPERVTQAAAKFSCNEEEINCYVKFVTHLLEKVPGAHANQPGEIVRLTQTGSPAVPGYKPKPPQAGPRKNT